MKGKRLKGRPALEAGKRIKKIDARFTEEEYRRIEDMEKALGLKKTDLVRLRLLNNSAGLVINSKELLRELDGIGLELGRAGNNINQLAKYANILQKKGVLSVTVVIRLNELLDNYNRQQLELDITMRRILRAIGK